MGAVSNPKHKEQETKGKESSDGRAAYGLDTIRTNEHVHSDAGQYGNAEGRGNEGEMPTNPPQIWKISQDAVYGTDKYYRHAADGDRGKCQYFSPPPVPREAHSRQHKSYYPHVGHRRGVRGAGDTEVLIAAQRQPVISLEQYVDYLARGNRLRGSR
jgi:hypothetical protein